MVAGDDPASASIGDISGDGRPDIVVANWYSGDLSVLVGNGDGTFQPALTYTLSTGQVHTAILADLNGDGRRDIISSARAGFIAVLL